jgi:chemotaxis protein MotB
MKKKLLIVSVLMVAVLFSLSSLGCAVRFQKRHPRDVERIEMLSEELQRLQLTKEQLENRLQREIARGEVDLHMRDKGLVVTVVSEVLFDSGRAEVRPEGKEVLKKVADVLARVDEDILIEGHTDNVPITHSPWKSNWELSAHRALNVLHFFVDEQGLNPARFAAAGYGPYRSVASNLTEEGRQKNRRVEIVILPTEIEKVKRGTEFDSTFKPEEYIK